MSLLGGFRAYRALGCCVFLNLLVASKAPAEPHAARVQLELFVVSPGEGQSVRYGRRLAELTHDSKDPDAVALGLLAGVCEPKLLHSTSWRWEKPGALVLTYLAYAEDAKCGPAEPSTLAWSDLRPPQATDPKKPRPAVIRTEDVLAHGLRHLAFLLRHSENDRLRKALSPESVEFFRNLCGQLAGRLEGAQESSDCIEPAR